MVAWRFLKGIPAWLYGVLVLAVLAGAGMRYEREQGAPAVQKRWDADKSARAAAE